jgi:hypothetical protein
MGIAPALVCIAVVSIAYAWAALHLMTRARRQARWALTALVLVGSVAATWTLGYQPCETLGRVIAIVASWAIIAVACAIPLVAGSYVAERLVGYAEPWGVKSIGLVAGATLGGAVTGAAVAWLLFQMVFGSAACFP